MQKPRQMADLQTENTAKWGRMMNDAAPRESVIFWCFSMASLSRFKRRSLRGSISVLRSYDIQNGRAEVQSLLNLFSRLPHSSGTLVRSGLRVQWTDSSISWRADYIHLFSYHTDRTTENHIRSMSISQIMTEQAQAEAVLIFKNLMTLHFCSALVSYHCYPCLISLWLIFVMESVHE